MNLIDKEPAHIGVDGKGDGIKAINGGGKQVFDADIKVKEFADPEASEDIHCGGSLDQVGIYGIGQIIIRMPLQAEASDQQIVVTKIAIEPLLADESVFWRGH